MDTTKHFVGNSNEETLTDISGNDVLKRAFDEQFRDVNCNRLLLESVIIQMAFREMREKYRPIWDACILDVMTLRRDEIVDQSKIARDALEVKDKLMQEDFVKDFQEKFEERLNEAYEESVSSSNDNPSDDTENSSEDSSSESILH